MNELRSTIEGLGPGALAGLGVLIVIELTLLVAALISLIRRPPEGVRGPKWIWALLIVFVSTIGPILYFALGRAPEQVDLVPEDVASPADRGESVADVLYGERPGDGQS